MYNVHPISSNSSTGLITTQTNHSKERVSFICSERPTKRIFLYILQVIKLRVNGELKENSANKNKSRQKYTQKYTQRLAMSENVFLNTIS